MFLGVNAEWVGCLVVFSEEVIAFFWMKMSQIDTEKEKNNKIYQFSKCSCIFVKVSTAFVDWNVLKGQQEKSWLSSSL